MMLGLSLLAGATVAFADGSTDTTKTKKAKTKTKKAKKTTEEKK
jgi:hypothetical protein